MSVDISTPATIDELAVRAADAAVEQIGLARAAIGKVVFGQEQVVENDLVTILAEERLALAVYRPEAFVKGAFAAAATAATAP